MPKVSEKEKSKKKNKKKIPVLLCMFLYLCCGGSVFVSNVMNITYYHNNKFD